MSIESPAPTSPSDESESLIVAVEREPAKKERRRKHTKVRSDRRNPNKISVGLEISPSGISLAVVSQQPGEERKLNTDFVPFPSEAGPAIGQWRDGTIQETLQALVDRYRLAGHAVCVGLGGQPCVTRGWFGENADVDENIAENRDRTHRYLSLGRGDKVAAYFESPVDAKRKRAWLTIARREVVEAVASAVDAVGLRLTKIEHSLVAACRSLGKSGFDAQEPVMLLGNNRGRPELGVSYRGQLMLDYRPASIAPEFMKRTDFLVGGIISKQIKCVRRYLQMHLPRGTGELSKVCLPSETGLSPIVAEELDEMHSLVTVPLPRRQLLKHVGLPDNREVNSWEVYTAVWLATEDDSEENAHADLMGSLTKKDQIPVRDIVKLVWPIAATLLLALGAHAAVLCKSQSTANREAQLESLQPQRIEYTRMQTQLAKLDTKISTLNNLRSKITPGDWNNVIKFAGRALPQGTWLRNIRIDKGQMVALSGSSFTDEAIYEYVEKLRDSQLFSRVTLDGTRSTRTSTGPAFEFDVSTQAFTQIKDDESVALRSPSKRL